MSFSAGVSEPVFSSSGVTSDFSAAASVCLSWAAKDIFSGFVSTSAEASSAVFSFGVITGASETDSVASSSDSGPLTAAAVSFSEAVTIGVSSTTGNSAADS